MPSINMSSTLPAIVTPRIGAGGHELSTSYTDDRGFALSGLTAASSALRGALFEATSRMNPAGAAGSTSVSASSGARPLSATTIAFMMSPSHMTSPGGMAGSAAGGVSSGSSRGSPGSILGYLSSGAAGGGTGGSAAGGGGGSPGLAHEAAQAAAALRDAAEGLVDTLEAAVRSREAQNRMMLIAAREAGGTPGGASIRPASARALDRALASASTATTATSHRSPRPLTPSSPGPIPVGFSAVATNPPSTTEERLLWVRALVRQTESGQAYAAAAEDREKDKERPPSAGEGGEAAPPGSTRRGPLPALRPSRREDVVLLQTWLADMLRQVAQAGLLRQAQATGAAMLATAAAGPVSGTGSGAADVVRSGSVSGAGVTLEPMTEPGIAAQHASELADACLYVVGVAMEELRRQVAAECRERGELLGQLVDEHAALVTLRGALAAEARVAESSAQWAALLSERERAKEAADASASSSGSGGGSVAVASSLAAQLVTAHHSVETAERRFQLADAALAGEAARRIAAEQQLDATKELLRRQEHEWLHHRAVHQRLENEVQELRDKLEAASRTTAVAVATVEAAREQTRIGRDDVSQLEGAMACMRQQYEGNEILVAAQRQQVRELEAALAALREQHREQALALGKVGKVTEKYEETVADLRADLAALQERAAGLEAELFSRNIRLNEVEERLATSDADLAAVRSRLAITEADATRAASEAEAVQRQMRHELTDALASRRQEETRRTEGEKETTAMVEMVKMLGRTMQMQGLDEVPGPGDRSWESTGPLGAAQRVLGLAAQHVGTLYSSKEEVTRELRTVNVKLSEEKEVTSRLQRDLYDARTTETRMLREKEVLEMKVSNLEHDLRVTSSDATKSKAQVADSEVRVKVQHETIVALQTQNKELIPLKKRVEALATDLDATRRIEEDLRSNLDVTRRGLEQSEEQGRFYQNEVHKLQHEVGCLQDSIKALKVKEAKLAEVEAAKKELEEQILILQSKLNVTAESHTETIRQLELAKFFLQGLDTNAPGSPARSSVSNTSPSRELRAAPSQFSHSQSRSPSRSFNALANQSTRGNPPGARLVRPSVRGMGGGGGAASMSYPDGSATAPASVSGGMPLPSLENPSPFANDDALSYLNGTMDPDSRPTSASSIRQQQQQSPRRGGAPRRNTQGSLLRPDSAITEPVPEVENDDDEAIYEEDEEGTAAGQSSGCGAAATPTGLGANRGLNPRHVGATPSKSRGYSATSRRGGGGGPTTTSSVGVGNGGVAGMAVASVGVGSGEVNRSPPLTSRSPLSPRPVSRMGSLCQGGNSAVDLRPLSGFGMRSVAGPDDDYDDYATEVSTAVMDIIESRGLTSRIHRSTDKWTSVKIGIMAWFSKRLRERLLAVSEQLAAKDLEIAHLHYNYMSEMRQREEFLVTELLPTLMPVVESGLKDSHRELQQLRAAIPSARRDLDSLAGACAVLGFSLQGYRDRETHAVCVSCQTEIECPDDWASFIIHLPPLPSRLVLSLTSLVETIVRIYVRAAGTVEEVPTWGAARHDTLHDAIMAHYTSQRAPGTFRQELLHDPESPVARLLASALVQSRNTKVSAFLYFLNLSPEGVHWSSPAWHFFLHLLHCLRVLLSGTWRIVTKRWATPEGVQIPIPAVLDLVGNVFNVQIPGELDGALSVRLAAIVTPGVAGPAVDLDSLLMLLVREYNAGNCPRNALLFPRRLTDGQLFNIFNSAGHNTHVSALKSALAGHYIGPTSPGSPPGGVKRATSPGRQSGMTISAPHMRLGSSAAPPADPLSASAYGASLLTASGGVLHPYGELAEQMRVAATVAGGDGGGNSISPPQATAQEQELLRQHSRYDGQLYGEYGAQHSSQQPGGDNEDDDTADWEAGAGPGAGLQQGRQQGVRWGLPQPLTGPAPTQPSGNMIMNFQIGHDNHSAAVVAQTHQQSLQQKQQEYAYAGAAQSWAGGATTAGGWQYGDATNRLTALPPPPSRPRKY